MSSCQGATCLVPHHNRYQQAVLCCRAIKAVNKERTIKKQQKAARKTRRQTTPLGRSWYVLTLFTMMHTLLLSERHQLDQRACKCAGC